MRNLVLLLLIAALVERVAQQAQVRPFNFVVAGAVYGRVIGPDGAPASGVSIEVLQQSFDSDGRRMWQPMPRGMARANENGEYRITGLPAGEYFLRASKRSLPGRGFSPLTPANVTEVLTAYYPGVSAASGAAPILIELGRDLTADFAIPRQRLYRVSGRVINRIPDLEVLPSAALSLAPRDPSSPRELSPQLLTVLRLPEASDGVFELRGISAGSYELSAAVRTAARLSYVSRIAFDIVDKDVHGLTIELRPGVEVTGELRIIGDASKVRLEPVREMPPGMTEFIMTSRSAGPGEPTVVSFELRPTDNSPAGQIFPTAVDIGRKTFRFANVPHGVYEFSVSRFPRRTAYVADIRQGGKTIVGEAFVVGSEPAQPIEVIINTNGITLEGFIEGFADTPAQVVLFPDVPRRKNNALYRVVHVLRQGRFRMEGLPPGEYHLIAVEDSGRPSIHYRDPEFFTRFEARSVAVTVTEGRPSRGIRVPLVRK